MAGGISIWMAFVAGVLSFLTPCVVPILPGYIALLGDISAQEVTEKRARLSRSLCRVIISTLAFTLGMAVVFIVLGAAISAIGQAVFVSRLWLQRLGGLIIVFLGVYLLGWVRIGIFERSWRLVLPRTLQGMPIIGPFLIGAILALGWTPCFGPILGAILTLAAVSATAWEGGLLLFIYSLGIGSVLLIFSVLFVLGIRKVKHIEQLLYPIKLVSGLLMLIVGLLLIGGWMNCLSAFLTSLYSESAPIM